MRKKLRATCGLAVLLCGGLAASTTTALAQQPGTSSAPAIHPETWPSPKWPLTRDPATEARIAALIGRMTLEEKVGQIIQADLDSVTPEDVRTYHLGSVLNGGNSGPGNNDKAPAPEWLALADAFYAASTDTSKGGVGIPIIWGTDAVHGHSNIIGATLFPHNVGLGAMRDPDLIEKIGRATAVEIRTTGQEWTFAPTVTVPQDYRWGRAYEGYSSDPALVSSYVGRMITGLQGKPSNGPLLAGPYVIASTKHFLADGGTEGGKDQGDARISEQVLRDTHGAPYTPAIEEGVATVMASFSSWQGQKMTGSKGLLTDVLKKRMNFDGFVVSDWNAHGQVAGCTNASCPQALLAGLDMYMAPDTWKPLYASLLAQARDGTIPMARLDDAVARILRVKMRLGLFEAGPPSKRLLAGDWSQLGSAEHRAIAREAVRKSLVLLKSSGVLPIKPGARLLVAGDGADDIARQSGGWTLSWQGTGLTNADFPGATSLWKGLKDAVEATGGKASLAPDGRFSERPDVAVVVFGETPYAEFQGDIASLQLPVRLRGPFEIMKRLKAQKIPVVAVMITGRPLFVNPALNLADDFIVTWLPGSEGEGLADVLLAGKDGKARFDFTGKLPANWPATARADGPVLFPFGYGLAMTSPARPWKALSEEAGVIDQDDDLVWMSTGVPSGGWTLSVSEGTAAPLHILSVPFATPGGTIRVTATDHGVQEGARRVQVTKGAASLSLGSNTPHDLTRQANGDVMLVMTLKVDAAPASGFQFGMRCGSGAGTCSGDISIALPASGQWVRYGLPLKCFTKHGVDLAAVRLPFRLASAGATDYSIADVRLDTQADKVLTCP